MSIPAPPPDSIGERIKRRPVISVIILISGAVLGVAALLGAFGVYGDWWRWVRGGDRPEIIALDEQPDEDAAAFYVTIENRGAAEIVVSDIRYSLGPQREPPNEARQLDALVAKQSYEFPAHCGMAEVTAKFRPVFALPPKSAQAFKVRFSRNDADRGKLCRLRAAFVTTGGDTETRQTDIFTPAQNRHHCRRIRALNGRIPLPPTRTGGCWEIIP